MTEILKPCPFCGGSNLEVVNTPQGYFIDCSCGCFTGDFKTREAAVAAWNTRAQTVFGMTLDEVRQMMKRDAERERTCTNIWDREPEPKCDNGFKCSLCGYSVSDGEDWRVFTYEHEVDDCAPWRYCPGCRAKVVDR